MNWGYWDRHARRIAVRGSFELARFTGESLNTWLAVGYPKSGTVWLSQLMSHVLDLPFVRNPRLPVAMPGVLHGHWGPKRGVPRTVYIVRDGRDVMVSFYHYRLGYMRRLREADGWHGLPDHYRHFAPKEFDPGDVRKNLSWFIAAEFATPSVGRLSWVDHVMSWTDHPADRVGVVTYEGLLRDPVAELGGALTRLGVSDPDLSEKLSGAVSRFDFKARTGRRRGEAQSGAFLRKGVSGDWRNVFDRNAAEVFETLGGPGLRAMGYETGSTWVDEQ